MYFALSGYSVNKSWDHLSVKYSITITQLLNCQYKREGILGEPSKVKGMSNLT